MSLIRCTKCGKKKPLSDYYKDKSLSKGYHPWCKPCKSKKVRDNYYLDLEKSRSKAKDLYNKNRESILKRGRVYYENNKDKRAVYRVEYERNKVKNDPVFKLKKTLKRLLRLVLTGKSNYTKKALIYKVTKLEQVHLINHLHSTFEENYGMPRAWINLKEVEIDHIIPISTAKTEENVKRLNHYTNLQLLFKEDNQAKGTKITT